MSKTITPTSRGPMTAAPDPAVVATVRPRKKWTVGRVLSSLASLRLTVVLFVLSLILIFCGTLAQIDAGIWTVVNRYFRSVYVWIPFQIFFPRSLGISGGVPFPGGWLLGGLLLLNLLAAHTIRFKMSWKRSGIILIHAGIIVMMMSELVTGLFAIEGRMPIEENGASNYVQHDRDLELAIVNPLDSKTEDVVVIPDRMLRTGGVIRNDLLPFDLEVGKYMNNSGLVRAKSAPAGTSNPATAGAGLDEVAIERPEVSGTDKEQSIDAASVYVNFKQKGTGQPLGTYLMSLWLNPQEVTCDGKTYEVALRFKRTYKPYTIHLKEFHHDVYVGTKTPKNFSSLVQLTDPSRNDDREVLIYMNQPLRYQGETFYQSGFLPGDKGTILQVVRNPGWLMPYISCAMVSLGMLVHFGIHLIRFLVQKRVAS